MPDLRSRFKNQLQLSGCHELLSTSYFYSTRIGIAQGEYRKSYLKRRGRVPIRAVPGHISPRRHRDTEEKENEKASSVTLWWVCGGAEGRIGYPCACLTYATICQTHNFMASERITIRVPEELARQLRSRSASMGRSESEVVREALEAHLSRQPGRQSAYALAEEAGLIGCVERAPKDLSTNKDHFSGFGNHK
jgi:predicted DNA-binding protein